MRGRVTHETLRRVIGHWQDSAWTAHVVLITGDLVQDDSREAYESFCRLVGGLSLPVYCLPGNHDVRPLMRDVLTAHGISYCATLEVGPWLIACIDSCESNEAAGSVGDEELARLASLLRETQAQHVMVALHHPPLAVGTAWLDRVGLQNAASLLDVLSRDDRVRLALFGHIHQAFEATLGKLRLLGTPSTCRQFRVGSDTFAVDDRPPAYRRLVLGPDGRVETDVVWIDDPAPRPSR